MSVHEGAFPRKPRYYNIKIESFDNIGMINSEDIQIKENEIIAKIKELIRTETQRQR